MFLDRLDCVTKNIKNEKKKRQRNKVQGKAAVKET